MHERDKDTVCKQLSTAAKAIAKLKRSVLEEQKALHSDLNRNDFLWHYLLTSFATMGGVSGIEGLINNEENYLQIKFDFITKIPAKNRLGHVSNICNKAKVRYPKRKAVYITACYDRIVDIGGLRAAKKLLLDQPGREAKISVLKSFPGIGEKYARNIMMEVYHEDFRESIAIDSRIKAISEAWGLQFNTYSEHEAFYSSVARKAGLNGWELDRLMFAFQTVFYPPISIER